MSMPPNELAETWNRWSSRLLLIARAIGEPAEDAVQEAFLQLARQSPAPDDPFAWLVTVTRNQILQWRRSGERRRRREQTTQGRVWFDDAHRQIETQLDAERVTDALVTLESQTRQVIVMHLWGEMSFDKIADVMGCSRSTAHRVFQSGIRTMRQQFKPAPDARPGVSVQGSISDE
ncbi:sigma-70 family RNA polymerase sigma factor [Stieleria sp. ICT_E10.1]|uniref:sigma-70 family RNA polymerase sigma factor n=1 Tax=Stieleria sedimenti TaxID=2976331 RepID=UPI002180493E|nr:sigma-70 family RNA polymerase sigma factor [Stieleria sedimenti]MCS7466636.1 sigma-70 family RNA polymerase sigma factor [Stieleria sedimenti]